MKTDPKTVTNQKQTVSSETLDRVYSTLLSILELNPKHADSLLNERCLSDTTIAYKQYASLPDRSERATVMRKLTILEPDLSGVAGFFTDSDRWKIAPFYDGLMIPCRNIRGKIVAVQIRLDNPQNGNKYVWLSSAGKENGSSPSIDLHYSNADLIKLHRKLTITEGLLKADICAEILKEPVAGISGTGISLDKAKRYIEELKHEFPTLQEIILAPDSDWTEKETVRKAFLNLYQASSDARITTLVRHWREEKGLDDFLIKTLNR